MTTINIVSYNVPSFKAFVEKKNRKAVKLGCPEVTFSVVREFVKEIEGKKYMFSEIEIHEEEIKLNGWKLIGRVEENEGSIIATGFGDMKKYRNVDICYCEHCNTRRARKSVFIVENDQQEAKIVGSTCLADFVGHKSALQYAASVAWISSIEEIIQDEGWAVGGSRDVVFNVKEILRTAYAIINRVGFTSKTKAREQGITSTADDVLYYLTSNNIKEEQRIKESEINMEIIEKAIEWVGSEYSENDSDYMYNLNTLVNCDHVRMRFVGILVSLIPAYQRAVSTKEENTISEFIGNVGDKKVVFDAKCYRVIVSDGYYGVSNMMLFKTAEGNIIKYCSANKFALEGEEVKFMATIKAHDEYKGQKQTVITRAKLM